jgi:hypothetical protein
MDTKEIKNLNLVQAIALTGILVLTLFIVGEVVLGS